MLHYGKPNIFSTAEIILTCSTKIKKKFYSLTVYVMLIFFFFQMWGMRYSSQSTLAGRSNSGQVFNVLEQKMLPSHYYEIT